MHTRILSARKKCKNNRGFTIIEVLVASVILGSVFFVILSLLASNSRQAQSLESSRDMDRVFLAGKACIESFGLTTLSGMTSTSSLNFGSDTLGCLTGSYAPTLDFTGITLSTSIMDGTGVTSTGETVFWNYFKNTPTASGSVQVSNYVSNGTETKQYDFEVWK